VTVKLRFQRAGDKVRAVGGEDVGGDADELGLGGVCRVRYTRARGTGEGGEDVGVECRDGVRESVEVLRRGWVRVGS